MTPQDRIPYQLSKVSWPLVAIIVAICSSLYLMGGTAISLVLTDMIIMALFASSLNLIISYGGMVSFGHAAFFGLGAYGFTLPIAKFGMMPWFGLVTGPMTALVAALVFGALCVRLTHIYFAMLTLACAEITFTLLFQWYDFTGGDTGITSFMTPKFGLSEEYFGLFVLFVVVIAHLFLWRIVHSPLGIAIRSVGQDPHRADALGLNARRVQLSAFAISGFLAGIAGTLFSIFHANVFPDYAGIGFTLDSLVMVVLGGIGSFGAGIYGAVIYTVLKTYVPLIITQWEFIVGLILLAVVLAMPHGFSGGVNRLFSSLGWRGQGK
ncbi:MAG: branched-chain amino acid ABC transporter permease [Fimbriimonadaceae bacterium]|nr:branched-chain amino acid ABC transporter permease [Alphaproteobacteria bacterium]